MVAIDADTRSVQERLRQLPDDRSAEEAIAALIPKRHIEAWILCLNGEHVDENTDYHARQVDGSIKSATLTLWNWTRNAATAPEPCVESLRIAFPGLQRIPSA